MRKLRKMLAIAMVIMFVCITFGAKSSYAYREGIEIASGNIVHLPDGKVYGDTLNVTVGSSVGPHKTEYQMIETKEDITEKVDKLNAKFKEDAKKIESVLKEKQDLFEKKNKEYQEAEDGDAKDALEDEIKKLQDEIKLEVKKGEELEEKYQEDFRNCIPDFKDDAWNEAENDKIPLGKKDYSGTKKWIVWVRVTPTADTSKVYYTASQFELEGNRVYTVNIEKTETTLEVGGTEALKYVISPADAVNKKVTWKSDNESVATVDANGTVTAKAEGTATITVTTEDGNKTDTCKVIVKAKGANDGVEAGSAQDGSMANKPHANTGVSNAMIFVIAGVAIVAIVLGKKYKNTKIK